MHHVDPLFQTCVPVSGNIVVSKQLSRFSHSFMTEISQFPGGLRPQQFPATHTIAIHSELATVRSESQKKIAFKSDVVKRL